MRVHDLVPEELAALREIVKSCSVALGSCHEAKEAQEEMVHAQELIIESQMKRIADLEADRDSVWKNPWVWGMAGVIVGGTIVLVAQ